MAEQGPSPQPATQGSLALRTVRLTYAHWPLFVVLTVAACALQAAIFFAFRRTQTTIDVADALVVPLLGAAVFAIVANDLAEQRLTAAGIAGRVAERGWAIIALSAFPNVLSPQLFHLDLSGSDALTLQTLQLFVILLTIFAPVYATLEAPIGTLALVPRAIARSVSLLFHGSFLRAAVIVTLELLGSYLIAQVTTSLQGAHVRYASFWGFAPVDAALTVPLSVLLTIVYFDGLDRVREAEKR